MISFQMVNVGPSPPTYPRDSRRTRIYNQISPFSLAAIVIINFLLIYLNLVSLANQTKILDDIQKNTEIALINQELGLNISRQNHELLEHVLTLQILGNKSFDELVTILNSTDDRINGSTNNVIQ